MSIDDFVNGVKARHRGRKITDPTIKRFLQKQRMRNEWLPEHFSAYEHVLLKNKSRTVTDIDLLVVTNDAVYIFMMKTRSVLGKGSNGATRKRNPHQLRRARDFLYSKYNVEPALLFDVWYYSWQDYFRVKSYKSDGRTPCDLILVGTPGAPTNAEMIQELRDFGKTLT